jgi:hypothetical protein
LIQEASVWLFLDLGFNFHLEFRQYKFRNLTWSFCLNKIIFFIAWIKPFSLILMYFNIDYNWLSISCTIKRRFVCYRFEHANIISESIGSFNTYIYGILHSVRLWSCFVVRNEFCVVINKSCPVAKQIWQSFNYVSPSNEGRHLVLVWFFLPLPLLPLLLSEACPDHNFFVFPDRSMIFGMWVHDHKAVCRIP